MDIPLFQNICTMNKWKIKHVDDDRVLHVILKEYVLLKRSDSKLLSLTETLADNEDADVFIVNEQFISKEDISKLRKNKSKEMILLRQSSLKSLTSNQEHDLILTKGKDSVIKIEEVITEAIYRISKRLRLISKAC